MFPGSPASQRPPGLMAALLLALLLAGCQPDAADNGSMDGSTDVTADTTAAVAIKPSAENPSADDAAHDSDSGPESSTLRYPAGFDQLEPGVRAQFELLAEQWTALRSAGDASEGLGRAWGEAGQWFQVYRFEDSAMNAYREAMRLDSSEPKWPFYLGSLSMNEGRIRDAESAFRASAARGRAEAVPRYALADLLMQTQRSGEAMELFRAVLADHPDHAPSRVALARIALQQGDADRVVELLRPLDEGMEGGGTEPVPREVDYVLGQAYRRLGDADRAAFHLQRYQDGAGSSGASVRDNSWMRELGRINIGANHLSRMAQTAYRQQRYFDAARIAGQAARYNPQDPEVLANYASSLLALGRLERAEEAIDGALALDDSLGRAHMIRGRILVERGELADGGEAMARALAIDPGLQDARRVLGRLLHQQGDLGGAIEHYAELRRRFRELDQARFWHAGLLAATGRVDAALDALEEDLAVHPENRLLRQLTARLLVAHDSTRFDPARAAELLAAVGPGPASVFHAETVAMVAAAQGRFEEAAGWQQRAVAGTAPLTNPEPAHIARRRLALYREGRPCLASWEPREALVVALVPELVPVSDEPGADRAGS